MVFFTCSYCGESVKKPSVAKHYQTKCRKNEPFLTCVDCLKDFKGNEYEAHTKCLTEDERYSAKGYVPKPSQNKGERKQQAWQESIQTLLNKPTLKADERDLISAISKYENVPRKKAKFINFLSNAFRQYANRKDLIDRVWTEMEAVFKAAASTNGEYTQKEEKSPKQEPENVPESSTPKPEENGLKKEKKKKKQTEELVETPESGKTDEKIKKKKHKSNKIPPEANTDIITDETEDKPEKKNKKRKKTEENGLLQSEQNDSVPDEAEPGKKKRKKKHTDNEVNENETPANIPEMETKSKKKNKKPKIENVENNSGAPDEEVEAGAPKSGKKRKKSENKENCSEKMETGVEEEGEKSPPKKKKTKDGEDVEKQEAFDWKATILSVLNGKNKIQLQKLQKKVIKRHCQILNCENSVKKEKKFMKKLKEMPQIVIDNDFVVLKS